MRLFARPPRAERRLASQMVSAGWLLMAIAFIHAAFGLWMGRRPLLAIAREGFTNAVDPHLDRNVVFWFLLASPLLWMVGRLALWLADEGQRPPAWLGRDLLALAVLGIVLMPASGFWLILAPAALLILAARESARRTAGQKWD